MSLHLEDLPKSLGIKKTEAGEVVLEYLDERKLPYETEFVTTGQWQQVVDAIKTLAVRGAPAIGVAGASAVAVWANHADSAAAWLEFDEVVETVADARPTAVNLRWAVEQMRKMMVEKREAGESFDAIAEAAYRRVLQMEAEDEATNRAIGAAGATVVHEGARILTHCNAGSLATVFYGTALGVVYAAAEQGKVARVYADETRPVGQGARLTVWELAKAGVPVTLNCDNMAASLMAKGEIDVVFVGADRIAANGDAANKIGTLGVAVLAKHFGVPFYVCAPASTFDVSLKSGEAIPIEQRAASEVLPKPIEGVDVFNPAFDVTPAELITGIVCEKGVFSPGDAAKMLGLLG